MSLMRGSGLSIKKAYQKLMRNQLEKEWSMRQWEIPPAMRQYWTNGENLSLFHWQPKNACDSLVGYRKKIKHSFHNRMVRIDKKYNLKADHSFIYPKEKSGFDEPMQFSHMQPEEFIDWPVKREFEAQQLRVNGQLFGTPD